MAWLGVTLVPSCIVCEGVQKQLYHETTWAHNNGMLRRCPRLLCVALLCFHVWSTVPARWLLCELAVTMQAWSVLDCLLVEIWGDSFGALMHFCLAGLNYVVASRFAANQRRHLAFVVRNSLYAIPAQWYAPRNCRAVSDSEAAGSGASRHYLFLQQGLEMQLCTAMIGSLNLTGVSCPQELGCPGWKCLWCR
jgi:hypothetical protein